MHDPRRDKDAVPRTKGAPLALEPLLDYAGDDIQDLFLMRMVVEVMALTGGNIAVDEGELFRAGGGRMAQHAQLTPVQDVRLNIRAQGEFASHSNLLRGLRIGRGCAQSLDNKSPEGMTFAREKPAAQFRIRLSMGQRLSR